jgi:hypothetical protein
MRRESNQPKESGKSSDSLPNEARQNLVELPTMRRQYTRGKANWRESRRISYVWPEAFKQHSAIAR